MVDRDCLRALASVNCVTANRVNQVCGRPFPETASPSYAVGICQGDVLQIFRIS